GGGNRKGYAGYEGDFSRDGFWHVRHRVLDAELGRWLARVSRGCGTSLANVYAYTQILPTLSSIGSGNCSGFDEIYPPPTWTVPQVIPDSPGQPPSMPTIRSACAGYMYPPGTGWSCDCWERA